MTHAKLTPRKLALDELLLDPNNPRFVENLRLQEEVADKYVESLQTELLKRFPESESERAADDESDESFFKIGDLIASMRQIGFVPVDRVVVRALRGVSSNDKPKYLVIEGNRRVSAVKKLKAANDKQLDPEKKLKPEVADSLLKLDVLLLDTEGLSSDEVHDQVGVILGLRHYGSVLQWGAMPRAKNIYSEYMNAPPALSSFVYSLERAMSVSKRLSVHHVDVQHALKTYVAFEQTCKTFPAAAPKANHYSLLQAIVTNRTLGSVKYVQQDAKNYRLSSESLERIHSVCQFGERDRDDRENILSEPKKVVAFAKLVKRAHSDVSEAVQKHATNLLAEVEGGLRTLDDATDALKTFTAERAWTTTLDRLLKRQKEALPMADFSPKTGNDAMRLQEAIEAFAGPRLILGV